MILVFMHRMLLVQNGDNKNNVYQVFGRGINARVENI